MINASGLSRFLPDECCEVFSNDDRTAAIAERNLQFRSRKSKCRWFLVLCHRMVCAISSIISIPAS